MNRDALTLVKFLFSILSFHLLSSALFAQEYNYRIEEDYTHPNSSMWEEGDEYSARYIENGMYISKAGIMHAQLTFPYSPYNNPQDKHFCQYTSDMEFTVVKIKGNATDFITIHLYPTGDENYPYLRFHYNESGQWKLTNRNGDVTFQSGTAQVNVGTNVIKIMHRNDKIRFLINDHQVAQMAFNNDVAILWENIDILAENKKFIIALDKAVFTGYSRLAKFDDEIAKEKAESEAKKLANFQVTPLFPGGKQTYTGEGFPVSFDYDGSWTIEDFASPSYLSRSTYQLTVYNGTEGYFNITTDTTDLSSDAFFKKYIDINILPELNQTIIDADYPINGQPARWREMTLDDSEINADHITEIWCLVIKDHRYYLLYAVCRPSDKQTVLSSFNSFKIN
jgi:hypothetical protein